jgi:protein involved in polysaccharide export with SLBB domain
MPRMAAVSPACLITLSAFFIVTILLPAPALAQGNVDDTIRLQPGDMVMVMVLGEERLSGTHTVGPQGTIGLPVIGSIMVAGKTLAQARLIITEALQNVIIEPLVTVSVDENSSKRRVYVGGRVERPGGHMLPFGSTVSDALMVAGLMDDSDLTAVRVRQTTGHEQTYDLSGLRVAERLDLSVPLAWDDQIFVPLYDARLTVVGQVNRPGAFTLPMGHKMRVLDLLTQAAGGLTEAADRQSIMLLRHTSGERETINYARLVEQGEMQQNYELRGGDVLVVPELARVAIAGEVAQPTSFLPTPRLTVLEALVRSGGFTPQAGLKQALLNRRDGTVLALNLEKLWRRGDLTQNMELTPGDVIMIPRAPAEEVLVTGAVSQPGTIDLKDEENRSLLKVLTATGQRENSDMTRVSVYRENQHYVINVREMLNQGDLSKNIALEPGDVVYVPDAERVVVLGAVLKPGIYHYDDRLTVMEYIAQAGGITGRPELGALIRTRSDGTTEFVRLNAAQMAQGTLPELVKVMPGDIIYFQPISQKKGMWESLREILWTLGAVVGLLR